MSPTSIAAPTTPDTTSTATDDRELGHPGAEWATPGIVVEDCPVCDLTAAVACPACNATGLLVIHPSEPAADTPAH